MYTSRTIDAMVRHRATMKESYTRHRHGSGFTYKDHSGNTVRDSTLRDYFISLAIPPTWTETEISSDRNAHILACGYDDAGRKQYIYHPEWHEKQSLARSKKLTKLIQAMPRLRKHISKDSEKEVGSKEYVLAHAVRLLDVTGIRPGSNRYYEQHGTHGLTTLRSKHLSVDEEHATLEFVGKSSKEHELIIDDEELIEALENLDDIPGYELFQYYNEQGEKKTLTRNEINEYLREISGLDITAKYLRMWRGSVACADKILSLSEDGLVTFKENQHVEIFNHVADTLGNTRTIAEGHYIHDALLKVLDQKTHSIPSFTKKPLLSEAESYLLALVS